MLKIIRRWWRRLRCRHPVELVGVEKHWKHGMPVEVWRFYCAKCDTDFYY